MWQPHKDATRMPTNTLTTTTTRATPTGAATPANTTSTTHRPKAPPTATTAYNYNNGDNTSQPLDYVQLLRNKSLPPLPWHYANTGQMPAALSLLAHTSAAGAALLLSPTATAAPTTTAAHINNLLPGLGAAAAAATLAPLAPFGLGLSLDRLPIDLLTDIFVRLNTCLLGRATTSCPDNSAPSAAAPAIALHDALFSASSAAATTTADNRQLLAERRESLRSQFSPQGSLAMNAALNLKRKRSDYTLAEREAHVERRPLCGSGDGALAMANGEADDIELLPPPKKKWIRHYLKATQLHGLHNGDLNHNMIIEDGRAMPYASSGNGSAAGGHSPPRGGTGGSHYLQMMSSAQQSGAGSQLTHGTPSLGGGGRRRTISSNSNGAGTREVHNKLEKNRRAHLKECYETLKRELPLKDEDRKKTSNLAILGEALKCVTTLQKQEQDLEAQVEQLAKDKINSQRRIKMLRRELGPNYEPMFAVMFPDTDVASERETLNDNTSLSSGRGSILYSSSSSLSSGGSNGSTTLSSSPLGAGMQTVMPTAISPVISKTNSNSTNGSGTLMAVATTSPNSANVLQLQQQQLKTSTSASANNSPAGSPTTLSLHGSGVVNVNVSVNGGSTPLSLTAKNISAMSLTRGSPTPSTPSPSPSSSSCVSSSSSLISSSSPPMALNGVINGRNVTVSIPSNLKFGSGGTGGAVTGASIGNGTASAAATIIAATSPPGASGINAITAANSNNARTGAVAATVTATASSASTSLNTPLASPTATIATTMATITATAINNAYRAHAHAHSRKTSLSFAGDEAKKQGDGHSVLGIGLGPGGADGHSSYEDGEQPAKFIKVYNGVVTSGAGDSATKQMPSISMVPINNAIGQLQLAQVVGGGSLVVSPTGYIAAAARSLVHPAQPQPQQQHQKFLLSSSGNAKHTANGGTGDGSANELGRLPGGAELNILPAISSGNNGGSLKINGAFYHANGKLTPLVNGGGNNGILLKDGNSAGAALTPLIVTAGSAQPNGGGNGLHYTANFAQLLAATAATNGAAGATPAERPNNKLSRSLGGLEPPPPPLINALRCGPLPRPCTQRQ